MRQMRTFYACFGNFICEGKCMTNLFPNIQRWEFKEENKNSTKRKRKQERKRELDQEETFFFITFFVEFLFSCFLTFLFSIINSDLWIQKESMCSTKQRLNSIDKKGAQE